MLSRERLGADSVHGVSHESSQKPICLASCPLAPYTTAVLLDLNLPDSVGL